MLRWESTRPRIAFVALRCLGVPVVRWLLLQIPILLWRRFQKARSNEDCG